MEQRRKRGTGTVEPAPGGGFRVRLPGRRGQRLRVVFGTEEEAAGALAAAIGQLAADPARGGLTLGAYAEEVLTRLELQGQRAAKSYRGVWRAQIEKTPIADFAIATIGRSDVVSWVDQLAQRRVQAGHGHGDAVVAARARRPIAKQTAQNALNVLRIILGDASERGVIADGNPADGVKLPRAIRKRPRTHKPWTFLLPDEQGRLVACTKIPERERLAIAFSIGTGARQAEQWAIRVEDVDLEAKSVTLRVTKSGEPRTVALLPVALAALETWLPMLRAEKRRRGEVLRPNDLLWPTVRGCRRRGDPKDWQAWMPAAGLADGRHDGRHVRWHDLRHTCGTSLVRGWWGHAWSLEEVRVQLGHESVTTTERYAHVGAELLARPMHLTTMSPRPIKAADSEVAETAGRPREDLNLRTFGLGNVWDRESLRDLDPDRVVRLVRLAEEVLALTDGGDGRAYARAVELARAVIQTARTMGLWKEKSA